MLDGKCGPERLVVFGQNRFKRIRQRPALFRPHEVGRPPTQYVRTEVRKIGDGGDLLVLVRNRYVCDTLLEAIVLGDDVRVGKRENLGERRRRYDEPHRLEVAEPFSMSLCLQVTRHS